MEVRNVEVNRDKSKIVLSNLDSFPTHVPII